MQFHFFSGRAGGPGNVPQSISTSAFTVGGPYGDRDPALPGGGPGTTGGTGTMDRMDRGGMGMGPDPMGTGPMGGTHTARGMGPGVGPMGGGPMDPHHRSSSMPGLATNAILFSFL